MNLTPWFANDIRPVYIGVYNRNFTYIQGYSYWNGKYWSLGSDTVERAYKLKDSKSFIQNLPWRGILK